ncbi:hypothetical protein HRbin01_00080 [archaeon HR01]|nr:hypothetical protein HRbin01_00080 [archaeon HR01]
MKPIYIICEDQYGKLFFQNLCKKISNCIKVKVKSARGRGRILYHAPRIIKAAAENYRKFIVVFDSDGENNAEQEIQQKLTRELSKDNLQIELIAVACNPCIEEWIVANMCLNEAKPLEFLKRNHGYEKSHLPGFADRLDIGTLLSKSQSFRKFYDALHRFSGN